jgi:L-ascorbate metabolism protein UlaG (beta-lactamase superfamily)
MTSSAATTIRLKYYGHSMFQLIGENTSVVFDPYFAPRNTLESLDYAMLPIGDSCTMGWADAVLAAKMLKAKYVIPMHYNTCGPLKPDGEFFKNAVEQKMSTKVMLIKPCEIIDLQ